MTTFCFLVLVVYPLSEGPTYALLHGGWLPRSTEAGLSVIYGPLDKVLVNSPTPVKLAFWRYNIRWMRYLLPPEHPNRPPANAIPDLS